jgi:hypothetical protein
MEVKGTAFLSKRNQIVRMHGQERWDAFLEELSRKQPFFVANILATTLIPVDTFLAFMDAVLAQFFTGDERAYWEIGARSADWALTEGPYRLFLADRDIGRFLAGMEQLWSVHFTASRLQLSFDGRLVEAQASGLPIWHGYFEYMVMGYLHRAFELAGWQTTVERLTPPRTRDFRYRFTLPAGET